MNRTRQTLVGILGLVCTAVASGADWVIDRERSELAFIATLEGAKFSGVYPDYAGHIVFDPAQPESAAMAITVDVTSVETGSTDLNEGMADSDWFDFARFPQARFTATQVRAAGAEQFEAVGELTIKGVTKTLVVPFTWHEQGPTARLRSELTLRRTDFSIGAGEWADSDVIGFNVTVSLDLVLGQDENK